MPRVPSSFRVGDTGVEELRSTQRRHAGPTPFGILDNRPHDAVQSNFRVLRNPSRIDAKRGDHFLQADFPLHIGVRRKQTRLAFPVRLDLPRMLLL